MTGVLAQDTVSLREVVTNTEKNGMFLLNQGYRGRFTKTLCDPNENLKSPVDFEFTHGILDGKRAGKEVQPVQKIAVAIEVRADGDLKSYRAVSGYCVSIPDFQSLSTSDKIEEFVKIFGEPISPTAPWKFDGKVAYSTWSWMAFTTQPDMAIRVVMVTLTVGKSSGESKIEKRCIQEGIFHATGKSPVLEAPEKKEVEQPADGKTPEAPQTPR